MYNLYVAEKQQKQKEEKLKEERLTSKLKENRKSKKKIYNLINLLKNIIKECYLV